MPPTILIPDTNIFLHFPPPDQLDWLSFVADARDRATVLVTMAVIHELDDKKGHPYLGRRATERLRFLRSARETEIRSGVRLEIEVRECLREEFADQVLSFDRPDDHVLLRASQLQGDDSTVAVVTDDTGMVLKGETLGIRIAELDRNLRLKDPESEESKELRRVQEKLTRLQSRKAELRVLASLGDDDPVSRLEIKRPVPRLLDAEAKMVSLRERLPMLSISEEPQSPILAIMRPRPTEDQLRSYNADLEGYFEQMKAFLHDYNTYQEEYVPRLVEFDLWLENVGTLRSEEIDVDVFAPDPPVLRATRVTSSADRKRWLKPPSEPSPPKKPEPESPLSSTLGFDPMPHMTRGLEFEPRDLEPPRITLGLPAPVDGGCSWRISVRYLRHGDRLKLGRYAVLFGKHEWLGFQLKCTIRDTTSPSETFGEIVIRVRLE